jgi:hypothetical protein
MAERAGRRGWMLAVGVLLLVGLVGVAVVLWIAAGERRADNVAGFARAPVGCDTTLDFDSTGVFVLYVETSGEFEELAGACDAQRRYDRDADDVPDVELTLRDPGGGEVELTEGAEIGYDVDGFVGTSVREVRIDTEGDHVLTVAPTGGEAFAIAVGRSPDEGVALLRWGAVGAAVAGLLLGGLFLVLGSRRPTSPANPSAPWQPDGQGWPSGPPGFPAPPAHDRCGRTAWTTARQAAGADSGTGRTAAGRRPAVTVGSSACAAPVARPRATAEQHGVSSDASR